jgi:hypothetical protein
MRVAFTTPTTDDGDITVGSRIGLSFRLPSEVPVPNGRKPLLLVQEGNDMEIIEATYVVSPEKFTLAASARVSIIGGTVGTTKMNLNGAAEVRFLPPDDDDLEELFLRTDIDQTALLTAAMQALARKNLYAAPFDAMAFLGSEVNGCAQVSAELGVGDNTLVNGTSKYTADCWEGAYNHGAATAVLMSGSMAAASFPSVLPGFPSGHFLKATTALSSPANGDFARHRQKIEGYRVSRYEFGAAGSFGIAIFARWYVTASGVGMIRVMNSAGNRVYHREVTLAAGWNTVREVIDGDTSGTWLKTNGIGLIVDFYCAGKESTPATPNAWGATPKLQSTNSTSMLGTNNNQSIITGFKVLPVVSLNELPSSERAALICRPFPEELALCRRYWQSTYNTGVTPGTATIVGALLKFPDATTVYVSMPPYICVPPMRDTPTGRAYSSSGAADKIRNLDTAVDLPAVVSLTGETCVNCYVDNTSVTATSGLAVHIVANARFAI